MKTASQLDMLLAISVETDKEKLRQMQRAIEDRFRALAQIHGSIVKAGDSVTFADSIRPTYLRGLTAKVVKVNRSTVTVSCPKDLRYGRFSGVSKVRLPMTLIAA